MSYLVFSLSLQEEEKYFVAPVGYMPTMTNITQEEFFEWIL